jgi:2-(1,2-epoxy-1,2-dihydrophenyl)acetyl-CoA isomerase
MAEHTAEPVIRTLEAGVLTLQLNRPSARNAINRRMRLMLRDWLLEASLDPAARVVVLRGDARAFCAGGDVKEMGNGAADNAVKLALAKQIVQTIADLPKPVVAAVQGHAAGAGFSLALACDFVVVDESALFSAVFVARGLVPDLGASYSLVRQVGLHRAKDILLGARAVSAAEAFELGIAVRLWPASEFDDSLDQFARRLAELPAGAVGLTKRLLNRSYETDLSAALDAEMLAQFVAADSEEHRVALGRFQDRTRPITPTAG